MSASLKTLLLLVAFASAQSAFAQGIVNFANNFLPQPPDRLVRDVSGVPIVGTNFIVQLLYETSQDSFTPHPVTAVFFSTDSSPPLHGRWAGGNRTLTGVGGVFVPVRMQIRAWDGGFGAPLSFDDAVASGGQWGVSQVFTYTQFQSGSQSDEWMLEFRGFQLVPEPGTWALLTLGAGFLWWRYRRKG